MTLKQYMAKNGIRQQSLAAYLGCTQGTASNYINRIHTPSKATAKKIERFTKGKVKASALLLADTMTRAKNP